MNVDAPIGDLLNSYRFAVHRFQIEIFPNKCEYAFRRIVVLYEQDAAKFVAPTDVISPYDTPQSVFPYPVFQPAIVMLEIIAELTLMDYRILRDVEHVINRYGLEASPQHLGHHCAVRQKRMDRGKHCIIIEFCFWMEISIRQISKMCLRRDFSD
jgi:hypothetical protein